MKTKITISDIIKNPLAVNAHQGQKVFDKISKQLDYGNTVEVDFSGLDTITTAFLNTSIGQLYSFESSDELNKHIKIIGSTLSPFQREKLRRVMKNAKFKITDEKLNEG